MKLLTFAGPVEVTWTLLREVAWKAFVGAVVIYVLLREAFSL